MKFQLFIIDIVWATETINCIKTLKIIVPEIEGTEHRTPTFNKS